jgi:hypothetical protein
MAVHAMFIERRIVFVICRRDGGCLGGCSVLVFETRVLRLHIVANVLEIGVIVVFLRSGAHCGRRSGWDRGQSILVKARVVEVFVVILFE